MVTVQDILKSKADHEVHDVTSQSTVLEAARDMNRQRIGALVVRDEGKVVGIFTERDVLQRVVAEGRDPAAVTVGEVMTRDVLFCLPEQSAELASSLMKTHRVRHLPVVGQGQLVGMISIGDLNAYHARIQEDAIQYLSDYLYRRA